MPEPQIARRCPSCGVSIRVPASFCPECGKALAPKSNEARDTAPLTASETLAVRETSSSAETMPLNSEPTVTTPIVVPTPHSASRKQPMQATVGMVHRPETPPSEMVGKDGLNRVKQLRQISSAVIGEAAYDPSLRFVLVAAVLFGLFLALLLLSELLT